jgi:hypothetical protein
MSPSSHAAPSSGACVHPPATIGSQSSAVQGSPSSQLGAPPPWQAPAWHVSLAVQRLPSLQGVPSARGENTQPVAGEQVSEVQALPSAHASGAPALQAPFWQESPWVHASPSEQAVPLGLAGVEHWPVAGLHAPATWHCDRGAQAIGFEPTHTPAWQASVWVQALPSEQVLPVVGPQVPFAAAPAATLHAWQSLATPPPHAALQQTPSTQKPEAHSAPATHGSPLALFTTKM